ncbi:hypothetical protein AYL99_10576 [Fonsecaea erecta]|uniref:DNA (cytosine-5-)-methyltransferase n=1 Tax=Fonsecaea erecta TaxID=1367422 RepID=A0A178Z5Y6_9EURO|nr:hypothetical protein AYL99_10576 [Fonsecaea erecta]OAP54876.1 hypothetical protein AYL99_10576 [Fonsecaea erecta]
MSTTSSVDPRRRPSGDDPAGEDSWDPELFDLDRLLNDDDDEEELRAGVVHTGLTTSKDAIIASFELDPRSFRPVFGETRTEIHITIRRETGPSSELLGFIRYNRKAGFVELTNFQARMQRNDLGLGRSCKRDRDELAGCHGEGFKVAAVVLRREGHSVRFAASEYYWSFGLSGRYRTNLYCRLTLAKAERIEKKKLYYAVQRAKPNFKRALTSNIWEDVSVRIGKGKNSSGRPVSENDFRSWLTVSIDLNPPLPADIVQTPSGDLILDTRFAGHIYLKGLKIEGHSIDYVFGYNFARGSVGRDRTHMSKQSEETQILGDIWEQAILARRPDVIDTYIKLLWEQKKCPEVALASDRLSQSSACVVWKRLRIMEPDAFFYCEVDPSEDTSRPDDDAGKIALISTEIRKKAVVVSRALWALLRKFLLVRTPYEERLRLFKWSNPIKADSTPFGANVLRALLASLTLHPKLNDLRLLFVDGGGTDVDLAYNKEANWVQIHGKWFNFEKVHMNGLCEALRLTNGRYTGQEAFFCDHAAEDLFECLLSMTGTSLGITTLGHRRLRQAIREQLAFMPRIVRATPTGATNELEVRWLSNEGGLVSATCNRNICYYVTLHRESSCLFRGYRTVHGLESDNPSSDDHPSPHALPICSDITTDCDCPFQIVPRTLSRATFTGLDPGKFYIAMVAREESRSFFALASRSATFRGLPLHPGVTESPHVATSGVNGGEGAQRGRDQDTVSPRLEGLNEDIPDSSNRVTSSDLKASGQQSRRPLFWKGVAVGWKVLNGQEAFRKDEAEWQRWHTEDLAGAFSKLLAPREKHHTPTFYPVASLECAHLDFHFVKDEYALIRLGGDGSSEYVIFIHEISFCEEGHETATAYLLVTKYSKFWSFHADLQPPGLDSGNVVADQLELLLHFADFNKMGMRDDAEVIRLDDIVYAADLMACSKTGPGGVEHVLQPPSAAEDNTVFCRFAVRGATSDEPVACWTPLASHLLQRRDRWPAPQFINASRPSVVDFTPGILGPAEGFSQAGFDIQAAQIRHAGSQVFDGPPKKVLDDIYSEQLRPPSTPNPAPPNIALIAGGNAPFRLNDENDAMPSTEQFVSTLDLVNIAVESPGKPDFLVMLSSPAVLHGSVVSRFLATIINLLEHRRSVHMRLCHLQAYGLPQARSVLLLVASPFCAPLPWYLHWPSLRTPPPITLRDLIADLDFDNSRMGAEQERAFVCSPPLEGRQVPPSCNISLQWDTDSLVALSCNPLPRMHPGRKDLLTVRELARLQGFPDDFVFYQSTPRQYQDVWAALPPIISKLLGKTILHTIQGSLRARVDGRLEGSRVAKRAREERSE